ncbi:hypothetical protein [Trinickia fusca]|uniref:hypothetical protein n=1 Tax=Trinickia fusca TaxID=2419777 RepID=UPI001602253E|nr:hypothetical protein [Trinickia fusca]
MTMRTASGRQILRRVRGKCAVGALCAAIAALIAWCFAGYLTPTALLSLLTTISFCS